MDTFRYKTKEEASVMAGRYISRLVSQVKNQQILLLLSGDSEFTVVESINPTVLNRQVVVSMLEERYTRDPLHNNFARLKNKELYTKGRLQETTFVDTRPMVEVQQDGDEIIIETLQELATRIEKQLRSWKEQYSTGKVIAVQGIGEDGHIAGIMPYPLQRDRFEELFEKPTQWMVGYDVRAAGKRTPDSSLKIDKEKLRKSPRSLHIFPGDKTMFRGTSSLFRGPDPFVGAVKSLWSSRASTLGGGGFPLRVTATLPFLRDYVDYSIVYVVGRNKKPVLERVVMERKRIWEVPARILHQMKSVTIFTDIS